MSQSVLLNELTERELEVIKELPSGDSNAEIGKRLFIAASTVKDHIRNINSKLYTKNRNEIIEKAEELGLLGNNKVELVTKPHTLPRQTTVFIGRDNELDEVHEQIEQEHVRLVTILAPGGMGKTRLALEAAEQQLDNFEDGVYFVSLVPASDENQIYSLIAYSIGYRMQDDGRRAEEQVLGYLKDKQMLLVLDNWEHLLGGEEVEIVNKILGVAPETKIIATSREKLNLLSETTYVLGGLKHAMTTREEALNCDAVQLLIQSAQRIRPDWAFEDVDLETIVRICELTEGMPLGILLATSWLDALPLEKIADEIQRSVDILETEMRDIPERQRSIRAVFNWAWDTLSPDQKIVLANLSVFRGSFTLNASEIIANANFRQMKTFVNKSLLIMVNAETDTYDMHHLLRQYAAQILNEADNADAVRSAHAKYYLEEVTKQVNNLKGADQEKSIHYLDSIFENVIVAWRYAVDHADFDLLNMALEPLRLYCVMRGRVDARKKLFAETWNRFKSEQNPLAIHPFMARLLVRHNRDYAEESLEIAQKNGDLHEIAFCLYNKGYNELGNRSYDTAIQSMEESLKIYQSLSDPFYEARVIGHLGVIHLLRGDVDTGAQMQEDSLEMLQSIGDTVGTAGAIYARGSTFLNSGQYKNAERLYREALTIHQEMGNPAQIAWVSAGLCLLAFLRGDFELANNLAEQSIEIFTNVPKASTITYLGSEKLAISVVALINTFNGNEEERNKMLKYLQIYQGLGIRLLSIVNFTNTVVELERGNFADAQKSLVEMLKYSLDQNNTSAMPLCLPAACIILDHQGGADKDIVTLLSLLDSQPHSAIGWVKHWDKFQQLRNKLKSTLSKADYQAAWDEGQSLDLIPVIEQLHKDFDT